MRQKQKQIPFVRTKNAIIKIKKIKEFFNYRIPLILDGETGTSKTATVKTAVEEIGQHTIIISLNSQTTTDDLIGRVSKNTDSSSGFSFNKGKYIEAFEKGYCLILDNINFANANVLQFIETSLDSSTLSLDISGNPENQIIKMHPNFYLIATLNPLSYRFFQKRMDLSLKFIYRFQRILFGQIEQDEMIEIATGLSADIKSMNTILIKQIVQFHYEWQQNKFSFSVYSYDSNCYYVFTIRDIIRTIKSIESGLTPYESILVNYGSRYKNESKLEIEKLLNKIGIPKENKLFDQHPYIQEIIKKYSVGENMIKTTKSQFYLSDVLKDVFTSSFHLLENCQSILLVGPDGCGKTSFGRWIGELFSSEISKNCTTKFFICNPEMTIADIIGRYVPFTNKSKFDEDIISSPQIEWIYGPVIQAMIDGDCLILDQIDTAPSTIHERLNSIFDGIGIENFKFQVQENLEDVIVDPNFRIIAISSQSGLHDLSPTFLNRFAIIYIDEQLDKIGKRLSDWIRCVIPISNVRMNKYDLNLITKSITEQLNKDKQLTSYSLSKCAKGYFKLKNVFKAPNNDDLKSILDFCLDACIYHTSTFQNMNENFINVMLSYLDNDIDDNSQFDTFNFKEEKPTRKIMATLVACSIIGVHVILISKTGLGKTAAMTFSRTNKLRPKLLSPHIISFNCETQLDELYGYFTIEKGNFSHHQGQLSQAMSEGQVFIADKLNLADSKIIQSLNVAIEPSSGESIILPVIGSPIVVEKGFFFIGCQNNLTMNGRKPIPESIKKKILCIKYPDPFNMSIDIVFLVDGTNSMDFFRIAVCNCCQEIAKKCKEKLPMNKFRFGAVVYRDTIVTEKFKYRDVHDEVNFKALTDNIDDISDFFDNLIVYGGGGDGPEDWVSGYRCLLSDEMNWSDDSAKIVIHICDAPGHGNHFLSEPQFKEFCCIVPNFDHNNNEAEDRAIYEQIQEEQDREFTTLIKQAAHKGLMFFCLNNHQNAVYCLKKVKEIYKKNNGIKFVIKNQF